MSTAFQTDLFAAPPLPGLSMREEIITHDEESALIAAIDAAGLTPFRFHGSEGKRLTASFGWRYDFDDASFQPGDPMPNWLLPVRERAADFIGLPSDELAHALVIRYEPGAGIGWHRDRPVFEHVIGLSLGAAATMRFRRRKPGGFERASAPLQPRSMYHLTGDARHGWEHSLAPLPAKRWSITFRSLSEKGRGAAAS